MDKTNVTPAERSVLQPKDLTFYRSTSDSDVGIINVDYNKENKEEYNCIQTRTDQTISPTTQSAD